MSQIRGRWGAAGSGRISSAPATLLPSAKLEPAAPLFVRLRSLSTHFGGEFATDRRSELLAATQSWRSSTNPLQVRQMTSLAEFLLMGSAGDVPTHAHLRGASGVGLRTPPVGKHGGRRAAARCPELGDDAFLKPGASASTPPFRFGHLAIARGPPEVTPLVELGLLPRSLVDLYLSYLPGGPPLGSRS